MSDDAQLLRQYVESRSEPAFAELVQRHLGLVYHAAMRQLGTERHLAEDVAQRVFLLLAQKSPALLAHPSLAGWLHATTRFEVAHALRAERRRLAREGAALAMSELAPEAAADWERIRPVLDEVLRELNANDREAVLLRFFENLPLPEIGARLRLSENTAHKRIERALEKLRGRLARRGVTSSAAALATLLGAQHALAVPAGLATSVTSAVAAAGLPAAVVAGGFTLMSMKTTAGLAAAAIVLLGGIAGYEWHAREDARQALVAAQAAAAALQARARAASSRITTSSTQRATPPSPPTPAPAAAPVASPARSSIEERAHAGYLFLQAHPEVREAFITYHRATLRRDYADLIAALGLTEAETERFLTVLMNAHLTMVGEHLLTLVDVSPNRENRSEDHTRVLKDLLGDARYRQFRAFQQTGTARGLGDALVSSLYYTPTPLAPGQIEQFKAVAQQALADPSLGPRTTFAWQWLPEPFWNEVRKRASGVLSAPQLEALADLQHQADFHQAQSQALDDNAKKP